MSALKVERHEGISRAVYLVGRWAIKVPRWRGDRKDRTWRIARAVIANQSEAQWSGVVGTAPVLHLWLGGIVAVYPRCEPWSSKVEPDYDSIGEGWMPRDRKPENIGILNGEPVWLDYDGSWNGCPHSRNVAGLTHPDEDE